MLPAFTKHIENKHLFGRGDKVLLAISGGVDSVVLAHLLKASGADFALAHCNFKLRDQDSEADEQFCEALADQLEVKIFTKEFDVEEHCRKHKVSIQMAARELRYAWFNELLLENKFDLLLTAHHANDAIETMFINLLRGTGINGLKGIRERSVNVVRPLLPFSKEMIVTYARDNGIAYRTDKSNLESKYERNFLRLDVIPSLKKLNPGLEQTLINNIRNFQEEAEIVNEFLDEKLKACLTKKDDEVVLDKLFLKNEKYRRSILHKALEPLGFNETQVNAIDQHITGNGLVGKIFSSPHHVLTIDRDRLIIKPISEAVFEPITIHSLEAFEAQHLLEVRQLKSFTAPKPKELVLSAERLVFPLTIRHHQKGDKFRPFGMRGFKLLSDFFKDEKLNRFEKEKCKLLVNGNGEIMWVMGYRSDDRYKVAPTENKLIKLSLSE